MKKNLQYGVCVLLALATLAAPGCAVIPKKEQRLAAPAAVIVSPAQQTDEAAGAPSKPPPRGVETLPDRMLYSRSVNGALAEKAREDDALASQMISLSFVNAPAADVARAVIDEALGETVAVASGVSGTITLSARDPIPAADALAALEGVLAESNLALIRVEQGFLLTTLAEAGAETPRINPPGSAVGYGVAFAPIRYASPSEIIALIKPFFSSRLEATANDARSAIILRGPQSDIAAAQEAIQTFDTPHLLDRTFGMFRLQFADPATLGAELKSVLAASTDGQSPLAEILPLPRLNLLFVTARTKESFNEARGFIERLDQPSGGDERRLRYYPVQHADAEALARQLNAAFSGAALDNVYTAGPQSADSAVQPGFRNRPRTETGQAAGISTDMINNALIIRATDQEYREILDLIDRMDIAAPQVLIEATIAEVTLTDELSYGVRWFLEKGRSAADFSDNDQGVVAEVFPGFNYSFIDTDARVALSALASVTDVSVLSAPSIMVLNNQAANLQVGDEVPIVTQQAQGVVDSNAPLVSTLQLRETGVILEVKPRINASDIVILDIAQEVSDAVETRTSGIDSPTIQQRKFTSTVAVRNNGTVALGGLIRETYTDGESGIPLLKDIPGIGNVFKSRSVLKRRTELVIFLTPRIIRTDDEAQNALNYIRREMTRLGASGRELE